jgi:uncharacterized protein (TIGR00730 family)
MGRALAERGITLVYGGGQSGLMGEIANACLRSGGEVHGIITSLLATKELAHTGLTELEIVSDMSTRKKRMIELSDGYVMLPGGLGTFEEFLEVLTLNQIGQQAKPCGLLWVDDFFQPFFDLLGNARHHGFIRTEHIEMIVVDEDPGSLLDKMAVWTPSIVDKWS